MFPLPKTRTKHDEILQAANGVISHNFGRLGKELWTAGDGGEPITLYAGFNEHDEARFIVEQAEQVMGVTYQIE